MARSCILLATSALLLSVPAVGAHAQATSKVVTTCGGSSFTAGTSQYPTMNTAGSACGSASGSNVGGYSFQLAPSITVQNAAYSAGNSEGGLITITGAARTSGGTGTLINLRLASVGGATNTVWVYAWSKLPTSTCTDKSAFVKANADNAYALPGFPQSITLAAPGSWDTTSYATITAANAPFKNQDTSPGTAIYACLVTAGSVTPSTTTDLALVLDGFQD